MQNSDVAHRFFYDRDGQFDRRSMTVSYGYNKYWSYGTVIAELTKTTDGQTVCIISDNTFSSTTAKHISQLRYACPYNIYLLPQRMGNSQFYVNEVIDRLKNNLEYYAKAKLSQKPNREGLTDNFNMLKSTLELEKFKPEHKNIKKILKSYENIVQSINDPEQLKHIKELQLKRDKAAAAKLKRELNKLLKQHSYTELVKFAFSDYWFNDTDTEQYNIQKEQKAKLRKYFNPKNELSFVWFDDDAAKTSQHITVNRQDAETLLKCWLRGKLQNGMKIAYYTVIEHNENFVKIGCHKIPVENLNALAAELKAQKAAA